MSQEFLQDWLKARPRTKAIICDIDDTICVQFDQPIIAAIQFLAALDRSIEVHYVGAACRGRAGGEMTPSESFFGMESN